MCKKNAFGPWAILEKRKEKKRRIVLYSGSARVERASDDENDDYDENFRINFSGTLGTGTSAVRVDLSKSL